LKTTPVFFVLGQAKMCSGLRPFVSPRDECAAPLEEVGGARAGAECKPAAIENGDTKPGKAGAGVELSRRPVF
jgi:hypothetical protein